MARCALKNDQTVSASYKAIQDFEDLFTGKRSGHMTEYVYFSEIDHYENLVKTSPDYYPTRLETEIISKYKHSIAKLIAEDCNIVEIGPGSEYILNTKVTPLLSAFQNLASYTAVDINIEYAKQAANIIKKNLKNKNCFAYEVDCTKKLPRYQKGKTCVLFLGGTVSNFTDNELHEIFFSFSHNLNNGEYVIFSVDCNDNINEIQKAYNNHFLSQLTFNVMHFFKSYFETKNFDSTKFKFEYEWNYINNAVHLNLISTHTQNFIFNNKQIVFSKGEKHHLIRSRKFDEDFIENIMLQHNLCIKNKFMDSQKKFTLYVAQKSSSNTNRHNLSYV